MTEQKMKVQRVKGRALLHWFGKKPIDVVQNYPAQLIETVGKHMAPQSPVFEALKENWQNLLFHGDNKEVLSTLLASGFRGEIDLIYIDPPFDSGADYVRKVELRGTKEKVEGEEQTTLEQIQYEDIWANDNYLQFMYERLILLRELLSEKGTIILHCDWHKNYQLRMLMDEVFGPDNFINEITWKRQTAHSDYKQGAQHLGRIHDTLYMYSKNHNSYILNQLFTPYTKKYIEDNFRYQDPDGRRYSLGDMTGPGGAAKGNPRYEFLGVTRYWAFAKETAEKMHREGKIVQTKPGTVPRRKRYLDEMPGIALQSFWDDINSVQSQSSEKVDYPTQKPEELLERIIELSSEKGSLVLDCFIGSGTTAAVAQKLGRRWIGADINKGAVQTTMKRLQNIMHSQQSTDGILHYRVNNYDFQKQHEIKGLIIEKYGVDPLKTDLYFDGVVGERLVKIAELNKPITKLDVQGVIDELKNRSDEDRDILLVGSGIELGVYNQLEEYNKLRPVNTVDVRDIQKDGIIVDDPAEAFVTIKKSDNNAHVAIDNYLSPTIIKRLDIDRSIFGERIKDFRSQIDTVMIDTNYNGETFTIVYADVPTRRQDLVDGEYEIELPHADARVAVKITDMLGEETLIVE